MKEIVCSEDASINEDIRKGALALMKVTLKNYWAPAQGEGQYSISKEEKDVIRQDLFMLLIHFSDHKITDAVALMIVFVVQTDFPEVWPSAISDILKLISHQETSLKGLLLLYQVNKVLIKVPDELDEDDEDQGLYREKRRKLGELHADEMFSTLTPIWLEAQFSVLTALSQFIQGTLPADQVSYTTSLYFKLALKSLRLILYRFLQYLNPQNVPQFFSQLSNLLTASVQCHLSLHHLGEKGQTAANPAIETSIYLFFKLLSECASHSPVLFVPYMEPYLIFAIEELKKGYEPMFFEKYLLKLCTFVSTCISIPEFAKDPDEEDEIINEEDQEKRDIESKAQVKVGKAILSNQFTEENVQKLFEIVCFKYMRLNKDKLEKWENEAEDFLVDQMNETHSLNLYPASEYLIMLMIRHSKKTRLIISSIVTSAFQKLSQEQNINLDTMLTIDSLYYVFSIFGNEMNGKRANFRILYKNYVMTNFFAAPMHYILKRRVAQIIGAWSLEIHQAEYAVYSMEILMECFKESDMVTRVYAALALKAMFDDYDFKNPQLQRFIAPSMGLIMKLVDEMDAGQTTVYILEIVAIVIEKLQEAVRPYTQEILDKVFQLWNATNEKSTFMVKAGVIQIVSSLIAALVGCAVELESVYMPLLQNVLSLSSFQMNNQMLCLEQALKLWWVAVSHAPFLSPDVNQSFPALDIILERNENFITVYKRGMRIIQAYVLIGQASFLKQHLPLVLSCLGRSLNHYYANAMLVGATDVMQTMCRLYPNDSPRYLLPCLTQLMKVVLSKECPNSPYNHKRNAYAEGVCFFFDLLLLNPQFFFEFMDMPIEGISEPILFCFLRSVLKDMEPKLVDVVAQERVFVMGLASLLQLSNDYVVANTVFIVKKCLLFVRDVRRKMKAETAEDEWLPANPMCENCPGWRKLDQLHTAQLCHKTNEGLFLFQKLQECVAKYGAQWETELKNALEPSSLKLLQNLSRIKPKLKIG